MKTVFMLTLPLLPLASAQVVTEWGRSRTQRIAKRHRSLGMGHQPIELEYMSMSISMSMEDSSMSMVDYYPPVEEPYNGSSSDGIIGQDAAGNPIYATKSSAGMAVPGAIVLCALAGVAALF